MPANGAVLHAALLAVSAWVAHRFACGSGFPPWWGTWGSVGASCHPVITRLISFWAAMGAAEGSKLGPRVPEVRVPTWRDSGKDHHGASDC